MNQRVDSSDDDNKMSEPAENVNDFKNQSTDLITNKKNNQNKDEPNLEERVEKLEQLSKIGTLRSCEEYSAFGIRSSGMFPIDPDGSLVGAAPFYVYCRFDDRTGQVYTEVLHDHSDVLTQVDHCHDPGCYVKNLTYVSGDDGKVIESSQLQSLIELSSDCHQSFYYECTLAPLRFQDVDLAYWTSRDGQKNFVMCAGHKFPGQIVAFRNCQPFYSLFGETISSAKWSC